jgi:hypothetical protein
MSGFNQPSRISPELNNIKTGNYMDKNGRLFLLKKFNNTLMELIYNNSNKGTFPFLKWK